MMGLANSRADNWNMVGNDWAVSMLRQHVRRGMPRHAYLLTGPRGIGRRTLALRFAQALICTNPKEPGMPCGECEDCGYIQREQHPDVALVGAEAEGGTLKVEQIREQRRLIALKPYRSKYRIVIFQRFQEANDSAANALLKTLEEAPAHAILMLTAESSEGLLPTIVSRCEVLRLQPVPMEEVRRLLEERGAGADKARLVAHISGGCPGVALRLVEDEGLLSDRHERLNELQALVRGTRAHRFGYAWQLSKDKAGMREVLILWLSFWRDVLWRAGGASSPVSNIDREADIDALAKGLSLKEATRIVEDLDQGIRQLELNVNPRLLAEVLLLDWPRSSV